MSHNDDYATLYINDTLLLIHHFHIYYLNNENDTKNDNSFKKDLLLEDPFR